MSHLVAIVGPTGVGKSRLALQLAQTFSGEIISADSRQVYRYMDIATAKPTLEEQVLIPHYLIDVVNPDQDFSLAPYQAMTYEVIKEIQRRGKLPLLVGGSGQYVWSVIEGWQIPQVSPNPGLRRKMVERVARKGNLALYKELQEVDPTAAQRIDPRNVRRVIRALEVYHVAGVPFSQFQRRETLSFQTLIIGLTMEREELYGKIDCRIDDMIRLGLVKEVQGLVERGYGFELPSMSGIGYKEMGMFLQGKMDLPTAIQEMKFETHRLVRHQYSWFHLKDERIHWFNVREAISETTEGLVREFLRCNSNS